MPNRLMGSLRSRNISQIITERIATSIMSGELKPGQRLPTEEEFAARIGAGKSSVREAIKILEALGVLEIRRGDGTYVVDEFTGSMLDPVLYGILLTEKNDADVADFKVRVQRMAADDLLEHQAKERLATLLEQPFAEQDDLLSNETLLADEVANPLVGELYRQAIRIAAHIQERQVELLAPWFHRYIEALYEGDAARIATLLDEERVILAQGDACSHTGSDS